MDHVYKLYGLPKAIILDRDKIFTSQFWQELFCLSKTELQMSSAYHPQSDGQTERVNQYLEAYLRCFVHACPNKWVSWLSLAELWYNCCYHSSLGKTPFEVLYGYSYDPVGISGIQTCHSADLKEWLQERQLMTQLLQQHLQRVQQRMKHQADKNRYESQFQVADSVFLKLQPYVQKSVASRANWKLSFRYFGPYTIVQKINEVAYKLQLPESSSIHPVFHVSQLKKCVGPNAQVSELPSINSDDSPFPSVFLDQRLCRRRGKIVPQVLVKWSSWPDEWLLGKMKTS